MEEEFSWILTSMSEFWLFPAAEIELRNLKNWEFYSHNYKEKFSEFRLVFLIVRVNYEKNSLNEFWLQSHKSAKIQNSEKKIKIVCEKKSEICNWSQIWLFLYSKNKVRILKKNSRIIWRNFQNSDFFFLFWQKSQISGIEVRILKNIENFLSESLNSVKSWNFKTEVRILGKWSWNSNS